MDRMMLFDFFRWCTIINASLLVFWALMVFLARDWVYRTQNFWLPISRENFNLMVYGFLGFFKIFFIIFNLVPFVVLFVIS